MYNIVNTDTVSKNAEMKPCTPHDLRRTFITNNLEKGVDLGTVSKLAGHRDIQTTLIYDRR